MNEQGLLSLHEVATRKGVPVHDLQRAIDGGDLPARPEGGAVWIDPGDLDRWTPHPKSAAGADFTDREAAEYLRSGGGTR